jgi:hypothetical protein
MAQLTREQFLNQFPDEIQITAEQKGMKPAYPTHCKNLKCNIFQFLNKVIVQKDNGKFYCKMD